MWIMNKYSLAMLLSVMLLTGINAQNPSTPATTSTFYLDQVFFTPTMRDELAQFIDNVLRQIPSKQFFNVIDAVAKKSPGRKNDETWYKRMLRNVSKITPMLGFYAKMKALDFQKGVLSKQIIQLLGDTKTLENVVEIGTPAAYVSSIKGKVRIDGKVYSINDKKRVTDIAQSFSMSPAKGFVTYDKFIDLNDYDPISATDIPSNSVDLVICTIGLHHADPAKLEPFIASIRRILKPRGVFILRDHDAKTRDLFAMAYAAHSVFNVIMNRDPLATELTELRHFKPIDDWIKQIEDQGFKAGPERLLQKGDPTLNTMVKFTKKAIEESEKMGEASALARTQKGYVQDPTQTYLTAPEWFNVDAAQEYAQFINHTPWFQYPFFKDIAQFWKVFGESWQQAAKQKGHMAVLTSSYTPMNLFVGAIMTVEYGAKGALAIPLKWAYAGQITDAPIQLLIEDKNDEVKSLGDDIKILQSYPETKMLLIEAPRYKQFLAFMLKFTATGMNVIEIAGNKEIQVKVRYKDKNESFNTPGAEKIYDWNLGTQKDYIYAAIKVAIPELKTFIKYCQSNGIEILHIHDF